VRVPFNDLETVRQVAAHNSNIVAVLVEPIQGEGGINVSAMEYLRGLRQLCDAHGWLLMLDEVQCGIGRTGQWFVYQHAGMTPDVMTLAKGLGSGLPIGACLAHGEAAKVFKPGNHGSTFGGNPLACTAALATLRIIEKDGLLPNAMAMGSVIRDGLAEGLKGVAGVREIRGRGLMIGIELNRSCGELVQRALEQGLLINVTVDNVVRLLPPLVIGEAEARQIVSMLVPLVKQFLAQPQPQTAAKA
jgi:acetylornithine/N-succinyldiaminopimelate aminotransferase